MKNQGNKLGAAMRSLLEEWTGDNRIWAPASEAEGAYSPKTVTGELLRVEEWETENGPVRVAILADDLDGQETIVYTSSATLDRAWQSYRPHIGDRVGIAFGGKATGKGGKIYNKYRMLVERCQFTGTALGNVPLSLDTDFDDPFADQ